MPQNKISKLSDGRWYYTAFDTSGKRRRLASRKYETKAQFKKRCDELDVLCRDVAVGAELTFAELYTRWLAEYQKKHCSAGDKRACEHAFQTIIKPALGYKKLSAITRPEVYALITQAQQDGWSASVVSKVRTTISRPYNWAINTLMLDVANPTAGLRISSRAKTDTSGKRERVISDDAAARFFLACAGSRYEAYFHILYLTGLRPSEGAGIRISDIRPDCIQVRRAVTLDGLGQLKNASSSRDIPITPEIRSWVNHQLALVGSSSGWLFPNQNGQASLNAIRCRFKAFAQAAGVQVSLYDFRHTFATKMAPRLPLKSLQYLMGHSDIATTMKYYVAVTDEARRSAAAEMSKAFETTTKSTTSPGEKAAK